MISEEGGRQEEKGTSVIVEKEEAFIFRKILKFTSSKKNYQTPTNYYDDSFFPFSHQTPTKPRPNFHYYFLKKNGGKEKKEK